MEVVRYWPLVEHARRTATPSGACSRFVCYSFVVGVHFTDSADKHRVPREDSLYAMLHAEASAEIDGFSGEVTKVYIGHPHAQTDDYIEVVAAHRPPRTIVIFHAMPLSDLFRHLLDEGTTS